MIHDICFVLHESQAPAGQTGYVDEHLHFAVWRGNDAWFTVQLLNSHTGNAPVS